MRGLPCERANLEEQQVLEVRASSETELKCHCRAMLNVTSSCQCTPISKLQPKFTSSNNVEHPCSFVAVLVSFCYTLSPCCNTSWGIFSRVVAINKLNNKAEH